MHGFRTIVLQHFTSGTAIPTCGPRRDRPGLSHARRSVSRGGSRGVVDRVGVLVGLLTTPGEELDLPPANLQGRE